MMTVLSMWVTVNLQAKFTFCNLILYKCSVLFFLYVGNNEHARLHLVNFFFLNDFFAVQK